jgi:hypothetical protein
VSIVIERNRVRVYDQGNLVEERDLTLEDLKNIILKELGEKYYIEFTFTLPTGQTIKVTAKLKRSG